MAIHRNRARPGSSKPSRTLWAGSKSYPGTIHTPTISTAERQCRIPQLQLELSHSDEPRRWETFDHCRSRISRQLVRRQMGPGCRDASQAERSETLPEETKAARCLWSTQRSQSCHYDCTLPVAIHPQNSSESNIGNLSVPAVANSDLPGLLGLTALKRNRAVLDFTTLKLYFCGPNDYELEKGLPEGTDVYQLETAPSGHIVLPCCEYQPSSVSTEHSLTLLSRKEREGRGSESRQSQPVHSTNQRTQSRIPPPPAAAPVLPAASVSSSHPGAPPAQVA